MGQAPEIWWKFAEYEVRDGYIRPKEGGTFQSFDPWKHRKNEDPPYIQLVQLVRNVAPDGPLRLTFDDLVDWLVEVPKPVMVVPSCMQYHISVWPAVNTKHSEHTRQNQLNAIREDRDKHGWAERDSVLLDTGDDSLVFPVSHWEVWAGSFMVLVGWNMKPVEASDHVAQMLLIGPGHQSPGWETHPPTTMTDFR